MSSRLCSLENVRYSVFVKQCWLSYIENVILLISLIVWKKLHFIYLSPFAPDHFLHFFWDSNSFWCPFVELQQFPSAALKCSGHGARFSLWCYCSLNHFSLVLRLKMLHWLGIKYSVQGKSSVFIFFISKLYKSCTDLAILCHHVSQSQLEVTHLQINCDPPCSPLTSQLWGLRFASWMNPPPFCHSSPPLRINSPLSGISTYSLHCCTNTPPFPITPPTLALKTYHTVN